MSGTAAFCPGLPPRGCMFSSAVSKVRFLAKSSPLLQLVTAFVSVNLTPVEGKKHGAGVIWPESTVNWAKTIIVMPSLCPFIPPHVYTAVTKITQDGGGSI